jgi:RNase P/RNase MRP subunit p29
MKRSLLIKLHLYAAALLAPAFLFLAVSGGLYLVGIKGSVEQTVVIFSGQLVLDPSSQSLDEDVRKVLSAAGISHDFEYVKVKGDTLVTRPTSRNFYKFDEKPEGLVITYNEPSLQAKLIELHKGHGPEIFKTFQKLVAIGLLFVVLSGFWLGVSSLGLRRNTLIVTGFGAVLFGLLAFT